MSIEDEKLLSNPPAEERDLPEDIPSQEELTNIIMALIFASSELVTLRKMKEAIGEFLTVERIRDAMIQINDRLNQIQAPFELVEQAKGFRFRTRKNYLPWVKKIIQPENYSRRLSQAAMETLAIIAYKQPITKAELENVRGVSCDGPVKSLLEKKLVGLGPRSESIGHAFQYVTTKDFLKAFGLNRIPEDLPRISELDTLMAANDLLPQLRGDEWVADEKPEEYLTHDQIELSVGDE